MRLVEVVVDDAGTRPKRGVCERADRVGVSCIWQRSKDFGDTCGHFRGTVIKDGTTFVRCFTSPLRKRLWKGKYTNWMLALSDDQLAGLLWLVGEYAARACTDYDLSVLTGSERRKYGALNGISTFRREPFTLDKAKRYIRECLRGKQ